jgi:hypothetical protein
LGIALRASLRMHVAALVGMLLFCLMFASSWEWAGFWAFMFAVVFNTLFVFVEGLVWALKVEKQVRMQRELMDAMLADEEQARLEGRLN